MSKKRRSKQEDAKQQNEASVHEETADHEDETFIEDSLNILSTTPVLSFDFDNEKNDENQEDEFDADLMFEKIKSKYDLTTPAEDDHEDFAKPAHARSKSFAGSIDERTKDELREKMQIIQHEESALKEAWKKIIRREKEIITNSKKETSQPDKKKSLMISTELFAQKAVGLGYYLPSDRRNGSLVWGTLRKLGRNKKWAYRTFSIKGTMFTCYKPKMYQGRMGDPQRPDYLYISSESDEKKTYYFKPKYSIDLATIDCLWDLEPCKSNEFRNERLREWVDVSTWLSFTESNLDARRCVIRGKQVVSNTFYFSDHKRNYVFQAREGEIMPWLVAISARLRSSK